MKAFLGKTFNGTFAVLVSLATTAVAGFILWASSDILKGYGITFGVAIHSVFVVIIALFMVYVIFAAWKQAYITIRTGEFPE